MNNLFIEKYFKFMFGYIELYNSKGCIVVRTMNGEFCLLFFFVFVYSIPHICENFGVFSSFRSHILITSSSLKIILSFISR